MTLKLARRFEDVFWREYRLDRDVERAALVARVGSSVARRWIRECGGVIKVRVADSGHRLSFEEREEIEEMLARKHTQAEIARALNRAPSTISREIARNPRPKGRRNGKVRLKPYSARVAQLKTEARARRPKPTKLLRAPRAERDGAGLDRRHGADEPAAGQQPAQGPLPR